MVRITLTITTDFEIDISPYSLIVYLNTDNIPQGSISYT